MFKHRLPLMLLAILVASVASAQQTPLGSMTSVGNVIINDLPAPPDVTVFPRDVVRTQDTGNATITLGGKGSLQLLPQSELTLISDPRYLANLQSGTVVANSFAGATNVSVRTGAFVVGPAITSEKSDFRIEKMADGSFYVSCLDGSVSLIPLQGTTGRVLQSNQSVNISSAGELGAVEQTPVSQAVNPSPSSAPTPANAPAPKAQNSHKGWIILGVVGGGAAAGIAAAAAGHGGNSQTVSPSSP